MPTLDSANAFYPSESSKLLLVVRKVLKPKSPILALVLSSKNMLDGLRSRCTMILLFLPSWLLLLCKALRPSIIWLPIFQMYSSGMVLSSSLKAVINYWISPPYAYSIMIYTFWFVSSTSRPRYRIILSWAISYRIWISFRSCSRSLRLMSP